MFQPRFRWSRLPGYYTSCHRDERTHTHTQTHRKNVNFYWIYVGTAVKMSIYTDLIGSYQKGNTISYT